MSSSKNWNEGVITEFRKNHGKVGGYFAGMDLLLLHTTGRKSKKAYVNPVAYHKQGDRIFVFASKSGADTHPDWYHNLKAHPNVEAEIGDKTVKARAVEVTGAERNEIYARQAKAVPGFAEYEKKTKRIIPVIELKPTQ